jgi:beta-carotene 3-hydroxylase
MLIITNLKTLTGFSLLLALMNWLVNTFVLLFFFVLMEGVAWFTHKYIMHGFGWIWHKSHHEPRKGLFELNDLYGFVFALPSALLIIYGSAEMDWRFFAGLGIALYGLAYFLVHDVFVHQRVKWLKKTQVPYFRAMRLTHHLHHAVHSKNGAEAFGFLFVLPKYIKRFNG